jgi:16S rRNA processing protein RimM
LTLDTASPDPADRVVILGKVAGAFGVRGWVKINSYTDPPDNILEYEELLISGPTIGGGGGWTKVELEDGRVTGKGVLGKLKGIETPEDARLRVGSELGVRRSDMPAPAPGEYYWSDLEGLEAESVTGERLGKVDHFRSTPAGTLIVIRGERELWVPFVKERIAKVDLDAGRIVLDWSADWS